MTPVYKHFVFIVGLLCIGWFSASAQVEVSGKVIDSSQGAGLFAATITLTNSNFSRTQLSARDGSFRFTEIPNGSYKLKASFVGFDAFEKIITVRGSNLALGTLAMIKGGDKLEEVVVQAKTPPAQQKGDTLQLNASQFKVNPDANVEDLVKKMPGITTTNGQVQAQGEQVKKITVDGREFFGDDATAALRNLPADVVDKIQVFDRLSDQAQLTGIDDGNGYKAINIVTKQDRRNGQFGRIYAGYGTNDRYQGGGSVNFFDHNRRISVVGLFNNINQQNFSNADILGLTGGGSGRGGGAGRGGFGGGNNFQVAGQNGITKTNAVGLNYSDLWGKKVTVTGSYFYNNSSNTNSSTSNREQFITPDSSTFYKENSDAVSNGNNHRVNMRIEYKIDSNNSLLITPSANIQNNNNSSFLNGIQSLASGGPISGTLNQSHTTGNGYSINNNILFRHAFAKRGRSLVLGFSQGFNQRDANSQVNAISTFYKGGTPIYDSLLQEQISNNKGYSLGGNIAYTEPVGKKGYVQLSYNPSYSYSDADQRTYHFDAGKNDYSIADTSLSNVFKNAVTTQRGGLTYRFGDRNRFFAIGLDAQATTLDNNQDFPVDGNLKKNFTNFLPNAMLRMKLSEKSNLRIFYRSSTNTPSIGQLQNVINNTNTLFFTTGNPDLNQTVSNRLVTRYTYTNSRKGTSLFINLFATQSDNYITNATYTARQDSVLTPTVTLFKGSQLSKPVNLNGYWNLNSMVTWSFPVKVIKTNITLNGGMSYQRAPGLINQVLNTSVTKAYSGGVVFASNISEYVDFNLNYSGSKNNVSNDFQSSLNNSYYSQNAGLSLNLLTKNGWLLNNDVSNQLYRGLTAAFNQNFWLWNVAVAKKFLKNQNGELRLSVFDLLKQNRSISRIIQPNYIEDQQTQVLTQYFMLTFSYKIRNFGKAPAAPARRFNPMDLH
jgi:hypothetical protein